MVRTSRTRGVTNRNRVRRSEGGTSLQHKTKSSIHRIPEGRTLGTRAWKAAGFTPGDPRRCPTEDRANRKDGPSRRGSQQRA